MSASMMKSGRFKDKEAERKAANSVLPMTMAQWLLQ